VHHFFPPIHHSITSNDRVQWLAAVATALAAAATAWMAWKTRSLAEETKQVAAATLKEAVAVEAQGTHIATQAAASAAALKAQVRPWLTWEATDTYINRWRSPSLGVQPIEDPMLVPGVWVMPAEDEYGVDGAIFVRNVGSGIALINTYYSWVNGGGNQPIRYVKLRTTSPVLPPDGTAWLKFHIDGTSAGWSNLDLAVFAQQPTGGTCSFDIYYRDVAKESEYRARFYVAATSYPTDWTVTKIDYWENQAYEPDFTVTLDS
jgi:hypothetical protein